MKDKMIVTTALCYANGPFHLGHLVEQIQADIWVRFQRQQGKDCIFLSGEDAHGTAIMLAAEKEGLSPKDYLKNILQNRLEDLSKFNISYDAYHSTESQENKDISYEIFDRIKDEFIIKKEIDQLFDEEKQMFLPDRFVKGTCPKCGAENQYGDNCEQCGAFYEPTELINPISVLSSTTPIIKSSTHLFFNLKKQQPHVMSWLKSADIQAQAVNKLMEWLKEPLQDWDISRDPPYFGFKIPGYEDKYFYVWLDAPIGYIAALKAFCNDNHNYDFDSLWWNKSVPVYHFIGKDILYFHAIFWPAVLNAAKLPTPSGIFTHGFLTINKVKMSKSRGTFITAKTYLENYPSDALRYYFASKLTNTIQDIDIDWDDFVTKINSDLVGKIVNIGSRCAKIIEKNFNFNLTSEIACPEAKKVLNQIIVSGDEIKTQFQDRQFAQAVKLISKCADLCNQYIDLKQPWKMVKDDNTKSDAQVCVSTAFLCFSQIMAYLAPITPDLANHYATYLKIDLEWTMPALQKLPGSFPRLFERLEPNKIK
ncbi:MAG: methionine--tRNA ligase [Pseudomonadota bacterium]|nr:methionine--tRNA ligase [Pseudomonadota bacterium]